MRNVSPYETLPYIRSAAFQTFSFSSCQPGCNWRDLDQVEVDKFTSWRTGQSAGAISTHALPVVISPVSSGMSLRSHLYTAWVKDIQENK